MTMMGKMYGMRTIYGSCSYNNYMDELNNLQTYGYEFIFRLSENEFVSTFNHPRSWKEFLLILKHPILILLQLTVY